MLEAPETIDTAVSFMQDGLVEIDVDPEILRTHLVTITDGMRRLSDSPEAQELFPYTILRKDEMGWDEDVGFKKERDDETKDYFHYCPNADWNLDSELAKSFVPFLEACAALTEAARRHVTDLVQSIDRTYGTTLARHFIDTYIVTRILRYRKIDARIKEDAFPHFDRDAIGHHWWASHPGLMVYVQKVPRRVDELALDRVAMFPGKKLLALLQGRFGVHGLHGVRDTRAMSIGDDRIAIVTFTHCRLPPDALAWLRENDAKLKAIAQSFAL